MRTLDFTPQAEDLREALATRLAPAGVHVSFIALPEVVLADGTTAPARAEFELRTAEYPTLVPDHAFIVTPQQLLGCLFEGGTDELADTVIGNAARPGAAGWPGLLERLRGVKADTGAPGSLTDASVADILIHEMDDIYQHADWLRVYLAPSVAVAPRLVEALGDTAPFLIEAAAQDLLAARQKLLELWALVSTGASAQGEPTQAGGN